MITKKQNCTISISCFYSFALTATLLSNTYAQQLNSVAEKKEVQLSRTGFYENKGQIVDQNYHPNPGVKYLLNSPGFNVQLRQTGFSYDTYKDVYNATSEQQDPPQKLPEKFKKTKKFTRHYHRVDIELEGCNTAAVLLPEGKSTAYLNYFTAGTPEGGVNNVHYYQKVTYQNIYPNIDLEFYVRNAKGKGVPAEYQFVIHPGGNPNEIKLAYKGANEVSLENNTIKVKVAAGDFTENIPASYFKESKQAIKVSYQALGNNVFAFSLPQSTVIKNDLVIDPTPNLLWGTYYGMSGDIGYGIALDGSGNVYITGTTGSMSGIATAGAYQIANSGGPPASAQDIFVAKFNSTGSTLLWGTYYGGTSWDVGHGIALDGSGNVYITGITESSSGIVTAGAYQTTWGASVNGSAAFVAKFNSTGSSLLWGTYYGKGGNVNGMGIALDASNNVYITGGTGCTSGIATGGAYQASYASTDGSYDAYVAKLNSTGSSLLWGTYYGGTGYDMGQGIALDASDNVYITGSTTSASGITSGVPYQATFGGAADVFVAKFNSTGSSLTWGTYYGGTGGDNGFGIAVDGSGNTYITGYTTSTSGIATTGAHQTTYGGSDEDAFVAKFNPTGSSLTWGTYYGGTGDEVGYGIALDGSNNVYITGGTSSASGIATPGAYQINLDDATEIFVSKFNSTNSALTWGTYYAGRFDGQSIAVDASGNAYITGYAAITSGIATAGAYQTALEGNQNAFVAEFSDHITISISATAVACNAGNDGTATANGGTPPYTYLWTPTGQTTQTATGLAAGTYTLTVFNATSVVVTYTVGITQPAAISINMSSSPDVCSQANGTANVSVTGGTSPYSYSWNNGQSTQTATGLSTGVSYTVSVTDINNCPAAIASVTVSPISIPPAISTSKNLSICPGVSSVLSASGGTSYLWNTGDTGNEISVSPVIGTTYTVTISAGSCSKDTSIKVTINPLPLVTIGGNTSICGGTSTTLSATGGIKYLWSTGSTGSSITVNPTGNISYTVIVTTSFGCSDSSSVTVTLLPVIALVNSQTICSGSSAVLNASGGNVYLWNTGATSNIITVSPPSTTNYTVIVSNGNCTNSAATKVTVNGLPSVTTCCSTTIASGQSIVLSVSPSSGSYLYHWTPDVALSSDSQYNPTANPTITITYYVTITDGNGCQSVDSVVIKLNPVCNDVFIPNAFSPNADGQNDVLFVYGTECIETNNYSFQIFDRWGNVVFSTTDPTAGWKGYFNNELMDPAVFVYYLQATLIDGNALNKKGNISLIK